MQSRLTHSYYLSVIGFVIALGFLLARRRSKPSTVSQLLTDDVLFPNAPIAMTLSDQNDRLIRVNPAFEQLTGFKETEVAMELEL